MFQEGYIQVVGVSEEGQSRFKATRAAQVIAQREILEVLKGLNLYGTTTVRDGMLQSDTIKTSVEGFLQGAVKCGESYNEAKGYAEVCMKLYIRGKGGLYDVILPLMKENKVWPEAGQAYKPKLIPEVISKTPSDDKATPPPVTQEKKEEAKPEVKRPSELTAAFDGIIVDVRQFEFRPALVNTIITEKNEIVFDPSKILSTILVERGCGGFTTDEGKAKALLESWGSKSPMVIKGTGVAKLTNAQITGDDASAVYVHDQKSNLLAQARVVFLLK